MRIHWLFVLTGVLAAVWAISENNLAAFFVAGAGTAILYMLHVIEVKLNKLLDHHGLHVTRAEIARS